MSVGAQIAIAVVAAGGAAYVAKKAEKAAEEDEKPKGRYTQTGLSGITLYRPGEETPSAEIVEIRTPGKRIGTPPKLSSIVVTGTSLGSEQNSVTNLGVPWTIDSAGVLDSMAALAAPIAYRLGEAQTTPDPQFESFKNTIVNGIRALRWQSYDVQKNHLEYLASVGSKIGGLTNRGAPDWIPPGFDQGALNAYLGWTASDLYIRKFTYDQIMAKLPRNPAPYILEMCLAYAIDMGMKAVSAEYEKSLDFSDFFMKALQKLIDTGKGAAMTALQGGQVSGDALLKEGMRNIVDSVNEFISKVFGAIKAELDRTSRELAVVGRAIGGVRKLANALGETNVFPLAEMGLSLDMSKHKDAYPTPAAGWAQFADRNNNHLGGVYPGPLNMVYGNCTGGIQFQFASHRNVKTSAEDLRNWLKHNRDDGLGVDRTENDQPR